MFEDHFDLSPVMRFEELKNHVPHEEPAWAAGSAIEWATHLQKTGA
jgi:hypothetical protein